MVVGQYYNPDRIKELQDSLLSNPIDPMYDEECEMFDSQAPAGQLAARSAYKLLERLGKLPAGVPKWEHK